ncbi:hypothetical protein [Fusobacterium ulcerans]|uniref:hypothetical protein n=1 Tax=Fusobacterium ulcerans TaxID=861 RepID=UPI00241C9C6B|nr:hypothetical protein [Fusobacterium ulcerans]
MIKSKFIKDNDIVSLKPIQFRKFKKLYLTLYGNLVNIPEEDIKEFFLNRDETIINCKILFSKNIDICNYYVKNYFYDIESSEVRFSSVLNEMTGYPNKPYISKSFELLFIDNELNINILIKNSELK